MKVKHLISFSSAQSLWLKLEAKRLEISVSELLRRVVEEMMKKKKKVRS